MVLSSFGTSFCFLDADEEDSSTLNTNLQIRNPTLKRTTTHRQLRRCGMMTTVMTTVRAPLPLSDDHSDELLARAITPPLQTSDLPFDEIYEIERTKELLKEGNFRTVALQFPDEILHDAHEVSKRLQDGVDGVKTYILADTSYGRYRAS